MPYRVNKTLAEEEADAQMTSEQAQEDRMTGPIGLDKYGNLKVYDSKAEAIAARAKRVVMGQPDLYDLDEYDDS